MTLTQVPATQAVPIPKSLPPPYTASGSQSSSLRSNSSNFTTTTTLLVGPKPTKFLIHTSLLTSQSPYFRAALEGPFLESTTNTITLDDVSVEVFELCVSWIYSGDISPLPFKDEKPAYYTLLHLYILADRLCFEGLRNRIIDAISDLADSTNSVLTPSDTRILYDQIPVGAGNIRKLILDLFAFKKTDKLLAEHEDRWHTHFLRDLCVLLKRPCEQAMQRHRLHMWYPASQNSTPSHACETCRVVIPARYGAVRCEDCFVVFCLKCGGSGCAAAGWEDGNLGRVVRVRGGVEEGLEDVASVGWGKGVGVLGEMGESPRGSVRVRKWQSCKPWRGSRCAVYHEHKETEKCGEVFGGSSR